MTASEVDVETGEEGEVGMEETEAVEEEEEEVILIWNVLVLPFDFFFLAFYMNLIRCCFVSSMPLNYTSITMT